MIYIVLPLEVFMQSIIWLGMAAKYLAHNKDQKFDIEFDYIWKFWKTGKL